MAATFNCPMCSAPLDYDGSGEIVRCPYCGNSVIVPSELRPVKSPALAQVETSERAFITEEQMAEIKLLIRDGQKIEAIKRCRQTTTAGLKEAKDFVEALQAGDPSLQLKGSAANKKGSKTGAIAAGLFFIAIASIFPLVFIPLGIESWQAREFIAAVLSFLGAAVWALIWGGIGWLILFS